jgi:uncharacterized Zn-binding protein involved in type VI secretion
MPAGARKTDMAKQDAPHCHAPIHPAAPTPTPAPHPALPLQILQMTIPKVKYEGMEAAVMGSITDKCMLPSCVPNGPGLISKGSGTVFVMGLPAARANDLSAHVGCVAPIPSPVGKIMPPCATTVIIGG